MSKATVFHHFPRLAEVPVAALDRLVGEMMVAARSDSATATSYLLELGLASFRLMDERPVWAAAAKAFMAAALHDEGLQARMVELSVGARAEVAADLIRLAPDTPEGVAREIADATIASLDGLGMHLLLTKDVAPFTEAWRLLAHRLGGGAGGAAPRDVGDRRWVITAGTATPRGWCSRPRRRPPGRRWDRMDRGPDPAPRRPAARLRPRRARERQRRAVARGRRPGDR